MQTDSNWSGLNHAYLMASIDQVISHVQQSKFLLPLPNPSNPPPAIEQLCQLFGLSTFERSIILLCVAVELREDLPILLANHFVTESPINPTFSLALKSFSDAHWSALTPESPLRYWHLIELGMSSSLMQTPLRISERILHFLVGDRQLDPQLIGITQAISTDSSTTLPASQQQIENQILNLLQSSSKNSLTAPLVQLCGFDSATKQEIAVSIAKKLGYGLLKVSADRLPIESNQLSLIQTLWVRESLLSHRLLLLDCDYIQESSMVEGSNASPQLNAIARIMETCTYPMLVFSLDRRAIRQRPAFSFDIIQPTTIEQRKLWQQALQRNGTIDVTTVDFTEHIDKLVSYFNLSPLAIQTACQQGLSHSNDESNLFEILWKACLSQARPKLEELAQPIRTHVTWDDLVLPDKEKQILYTITAQVRQRTKVYEQWGFSSQGQRGLGISAMFAGSSGTGKTLAAEVLANELHLELYRVDLSSVVSKYIGETEKNLRRIFDAAEIGGAILLFDEADALFGKRSEVKDSHDRHANMEVAYLLQRMESYSGLAILTTNLKNSLDQAFLRRLRFVVQFPFPDAVQRAEIWKRIFPKQTPTENLSYQKLAKLNVPGGIIRNIALNAAFLAADDHLPIQMQHILRSAQSEYIKLERPLTEAEIKGWDTVTH